MATSALSEDDASSSDRELLRSETERRAFDKWRLDGRPQGHDLDYRLQAESEIRALLELCAHVVQSTQAHAQDGFLLEALDAAPVIISLQDESGKYLFVNRLFESLHEISRDKVTGHTDKELAFPDRTSTSQSMLPSLTESGASLQVEERVLHAGDVRVFLSVRFLVSNGSPLGNTLCTIATDITARKAMERRLSLLHAVANLLTSSGSLEDIASPVLERICSDYEWDAGALWSTEFDHKPLQCLATWSACDGNLQEFCHVTSQLKLDRGFGLPGRVWLERQPVHVSDFENEPDLLRRSAAMQAGLSTACAFPIEARQQFVGVLEFYSRANNNPESGFLDTIVSICSQIGQFAVSRAAERSLLLRSHELALAKHIQECWQPQVSPNIPGYDIAGWSIAAHEVGGDYFDFFPMTGGPTAIAIGDAAGHGLDSALHIAEVRAYIRAMATTDFSLPRILSLTNKHFIEHSDGGSFVTLMLARLDPATGELTYTNAGHLSASVFDANGKHLRTMPSTSFPLGVIRCAPFPAGPPVRLNPGDWVLMFTDGVIEARDKTGNSLGVERFLEMARETCTCRCSREAVQQLLNRVAEYADGHPDDDMTVVLIARHPAQ